MDIKKLNAFLLESLPIGYASGSKNYQTLPDGWKQFKYPEEEFVFIDKYRGENPFGGCTIVMCNDDPEEWIMNYYGKVYNPFTRSAIDLTSERAARKVEWFYKFLRQALLRPSPGMPIRGPRVFYGKGEYEPLTYEIETSGTLKDFTAKEIIKDGGQEIYLCHIQGGILGYKNINESENKVISIEAKMAEKLGL